MGNVSTVVLNSITAVAATAAVVIGGFALKTARDQKAAVKAANENAKVTADFVKANEKGLKLLAESGDVVVYQILDGRNVEDIRKEIEEARAKEAEVKEIGSAASGIAKKLCEINKEVLSLVQRQENLMGQNGRIDSEEENEG